MAALVGYSRFLLSEVGHYVLFVAAASLLRHAEGCLFQTSLPHEARERHNEIVQRQGLSSVVISPPVVMCRAVESRASPQSIETPAQDFHISQIFVTSTGFLIGNKIIKPNEKSRNIPKGSRDTMGDSLLPLNSCN